MRIKTSILLLFALLCSAVGVDAQQRDITIACDWGDIAATMATPEGDTSTAVVIVAGSGPTDRNGNSSAGLVTYAYKMLSDELVERGLAVLRYDKRAIGGSHYPAERIAQVEFQDFVDDAAKCVAYLRNEGYDRVFVVGHSEGGQIALELAARKDVKVDGLVLLCAAGYSIDVILERQLAAQLYPSNIGLLLSARNIITRLKSGQRVPNEQVPDMLKSLFGEGVQPFLISSMASDPQRLASECELPMLIVTGGRDVQVSVDNGERLAEAAPNARHITFENMAHVLKDTTTSDRVEQLLSVYNDGWLTLTDGLTAEIATFISNSQQ